MYSQKNIKIKPKTSNNKHKQTKPKPTITKTSSKPTTTQATAKTKARKQPNNPPSINEENVGEPAPMEDIPAIKQDIKPKQLKSKTFASKINIPKPKSKAIPNKPKPDPNSLQTPMDTTNTTNNIIPTDGNHNNNILDNNNEINLDQIVVSTTSAAMAGAVGVSFKAKPKLTQPVTPNVLKRSRIASRPRPTKAVTPIVLKRSR